MSALDDYEVYQGEYPITAIDGAITDVNEIKTYMPSDVSSDNQLVTENQLENYVYGAVDAKQDELTTAQLAAANSGIDSDMVAWIQANEGNFDTMYGGVGKNILPNNITNGQQTAGITATVNSNLTVGLSGTAGDSSDAVFILCENVPVPAGSYVLSGCPSGGSSSTYKMILTVNNTTDYVDTGDGVAVELSSDSLIKAQIVVNHGTAAPSYAFSPMLCTEAAYTASTAYVKYANVAPLSEIFKTELFGLNSEVQDARVGTNAHVYDSIGDRIDDDEKEAFVTRGIIENDSNINDYDTAGQWTKVSSATAENWPEEASPVGRLLTFANKSSGNSGIAQIVIDYANNMFVRYKKSAGWLDWNKVLITDDYEELDTKIDTCALEAPITRGTITNNSDVNSYDTSGQWTKVNNVTAANWPTGASSVGRLITFANKDSGNSGIAQIVIDYSGNVFARYKKSSGWTDWNKLQTSSDYNTLDTKIDTCALEAPITRGTMQNNTSVDSYDTAGQWTKTAGVSVTNWPSGASSVGRLLTFANKDSGNAGIAQIVVDYGNNVFVRYKTGSGWRAWNKVKTDVAYTTLEVGVGKAYTSVVEAIKYTMDHPPTANNCYIISIEAGTFDLSGCVAYIESSAIDFRGLYIMPGTILKGAGKDKTFLELRYTGSSDAIMTEVSGLNAPYECEISDLTLTVKNVRYAVHSDNALATESSSVSNAKLRDNTITCKNCAFIHEGFDSGLTPSYKVPSAWGAGTWDNANRMFINCDFVSAVYAGLLFHDRIGLTRTCDITFDNCRCVNLGADSPDVTVNGSSVALISWGSGVKANVYFKNSLANKGIAFRVVTNYNENTTADYYVKSDGKTLICESTVNDSHENDNYYTGGCEIGKATSSISAYTPVSSTTFFSVGAYNSSSGVYGIALHDCASGDSVVYQKSGYIQLSKLTSSTFTAGALLAYNGSAWVESNTNPTLRVVGSGIAEFI